MLGPIHYLPREKPYDHRFVVDELEVMSDRNAALRVNQAVSSLVWGQVSKFQPERAQDFPLGTARVAVQVNAALLVEMDSERGALIRVSATSSGPVSSLPWTDFIEAGE